MSVFCKNWNEAVNWVLLSGRNYVHEICTIEKRDGDRSIAILTVGKTERYTPDDAVRALEDRFDF